MYHLIDAAREGLTVRATAVGGQVLVRLVGEVDIANSRWAQRLLESMTPDARGMTLDLSGVTFFSSAGLHMLDNLTRHCHRLGVSLTIDRPSRRARRVLELDVTVPRPRSQPEKTLV